MKQRYYLVTIAWKKINSSSACIGNVLVKGSPAEHLVSHTCEDEKVRLLFAMEVTEEFYRRYKYNWNFDSGMYI